MTTEIVDTPTGQVVHLSRYPAFPGKQGRAYCSASFNYDDELAHPYTNEWKASDKPPCSRCTHNFRLEQQRVSKMLKAYGFEV